MPISGTISENREEKAKSQLSSQLVENIQQPAHNFKTLITNESANDVCSK